MGADQSSDNKSDPGEEQPEQQTLYRRRPRRQNRRNQSGQGQWQHQRDKSETRYRKDTHDDELSCPTCDGTFGLEVYQCNRGHSSCSDCWAFQRPCGLCGNRLIMRNIVFEQHLATRKVLCHNRQDGCTLVLKLGELEDHIKECPFQLLSCPAGCCWRGKIRQLRGHFNAMHPDLNFVPDSEIDLDDFSNDGQYVFLAVKGFHFFLFHLKVSESERKVFMTVQLISTKVSASKWSYEIHIYNKSECWRKYTFTDVCSSFNEPVDDIFKEGRCCVLPYRYAKTFIDKDAMTLKCSLLNH